MESTGSSRPLSKLSPFALQKGIQGLAGVAKNITRLRSGQILIEVDKKSHANNLLQSTMIVDVPIRISSHKSLNYKKGIIRSRDLKGCSDEEILKSDGAKQQGITDVKRFKIKKKGEIIDTNTFLITFGLPTLPKYIKLAYLHLPVEIHIPNPMRCFVCQRFGHHRYNCRRKPTCARCGTEGHEDTSCEATPCCVNCGEAHNAYSKDCPRWIKEKEIQRIKSTMNVSFLEARKIVEASVPSHHSGQSYAQAAATITERKNTRNAVTQTVITWPEGGKPSTIQTTRTSEVQTEKSGNQIPTENNKNSNINQNVKTTPITHNKARPTKPSTEIQNNKPEIANKPTKLSKKQDIHAHRPQKGSLNPIADFNRFDILHDILAEQQQMELEVGDALDRGFPSEPQNKTFDPS
jgi:hypothetical protein